MIEQDRAEKEEEKKRKAEEEKLKKLYNKSKMN